MKKRITSLALLILMLCTSLLSACSDGSGTSDSGQSASDTTSAQSVTTAETTAPPEYENPGLDYDGREFIFGSFLEENPSWTSRKYSEAYVEAENGDPINDAVYKRTAEVEEELNIKIKPAHFGNVETLTAAVMAGDRYADCAIMTGSHMLSVKNKDLATDLFTIDTLDLDASWWNQNCIDNFSVGGQLFGAAGDISVIGLLAGHCVYVNKDMVNDFELDNPYDAVRDGTWTMDKTAEMATVVAADLNGDGIMDGNDRFGIECESGIGTVRVMASGVKITAKDENDLPTLAIDPDLASAAVEKMVTLWRDKSLTLYAQDFSGKGYSNVFRDFIFELFISDQILFINNWLVWTLDLRVMESDFGILPPPKLTEAQEEYVVGMTEAFTTYAVVPVSVSDTDFIGNVMNALGYYGQVHLYPALMETTVTNKAIRDDDSLEMLELIYDSRYYEPAILYGWGGVSTMFNSFISGNNTNFASTYASYESKIAAAMEEAA